MAPRTRTPDKNTLERWRDAGLTQAQMVEKTQAEFGESVTRSAIANAMVRFGLSIPGDRYEDHVPWQVNPLHVTAHPLRMLRLMGRRDSGKDINDRERDMLDSWLKDLKANNLIVGYDFNDSMGFHYISAEYKDHKGKPPVRRRQLQMEAVAAPTRRKSRGSSASA